MLNEEYRVPTEMDVANAQAFISAKDQMIGSAIDEIIHGANLLALIDKFAQPSQIELEERKLEICIERINDALADARTVIGQELRDLFYAATREREVIIEALEEAEDAAWEEERRTYWENRI